MADEHWSKYEEREAQRAELYRRDVETAIADRAQAMEIRARQAALYEKDLAQRQTNLAQTLRTAVAAEVLGAMVGATLHAPKANTEEGAATILSAFPVAAVRLADALLAELAKEPK